jgi:hypothetical protein
MFNMGEPIVARELMCQDDQVRLAMKTGGKPCVADAAVALALASAPAAKVGALTAPSAEGPAPAAALMAVAVAAKGPAAAPIPEWCGRAAPSTEASKAYVAQVCSKA